MTKKAFGFVLSAVLFVCAAFPALAVPPGEIELKSEAAVLMDGDTGQVLFEKEMHRRMYPASITKIMTALLALERGNLGDTITMSHDAVFSVGRDTSHIALDTGEELTLAQALYALALVSANDAANGIAEHIGGSMENFAAMMNSRAGEAGALDTHFTNAHGLFDENHYTTAYDMARITLAALKLPKFAEIFGALSYEIPPTNKQRETRYFSSANPMLTGEHKYEGVIAGKTGYIDESGRTLMTAAERDGRTLIAVVMKAAGKNDACEDTAALLDYGFAELPRRNYTAEEPASVYVDAQAEEQAGGPEDKSPSSLPWVFGAAGLLPAGALFLLAWRYIPAKRRCKRKRSAYALTRLASKCFTFGLTWHLF